jgi:hypothetical protein
VRTIQAANNEIVKAIIDYLKKLKSGDGLPANARDRIIKMLENSSLFKEFYKNCTAKERIVQVDFEFEGKSGGGNEWKLKITIDVDKPPKDQHMGYEIHLNGRKVQVGHAYVPDDQLEIGRPTLHNANLLKDIPDGESGEIGFQVREGGGSMKWKYTSKRSNAPD